MHLELSFVLSTFFSLQAPSLFFSQTNFTVTLPLRIPGVKLSYFLPEQLQLDLLSVFGTNVFRK